MDLAWTDLQRYATLPRWWYNAFVLGDPTRLNRTPDATLQHASPLMQQIPASGMQTSALVKWVRVDAPVL